MDVKPRKLTAKELTQAFAAYARRHNEYQSTVRQNTVLRLAAIAEWRQRHQDAS